MVLTSQLASDTNMASNVHFHRRMDLLKELSDYWKCGDEVGLVEVEERGICT